jgi:hypothetical protein
MLWTHLKESHSPGEVAHYVSMLYMDTWISKMAKMAERMQKLD